MEPAKLTLTIDSIQALSRECYYNSLDEETLEFIMTKFGQELMKEQFFITPLEVEHKFKITRDQQKIFRNRVLDPLPYHKQTNCKNCKILYVTEDFLKWLHRNVLPGAL